MTTLAALQSRIAQGESETLELKRSTAELKRAGETLCAFLNEEGGKVLIGVGPAGKLIGQEVADITLRDIAAMLGRFGPPARVGMSRVAVGSSRQVIVIEVAPSRQFAPFVFESRPYKRVGSTTTVMSQEEYAHLLRDRNHSRHRWENQPAEGVRLEDLDREDRLPVPAEALREIVINAVIHRDVSNPSSYVAIAVFDDRIEIHSIGDFPSGVRAEQLSREHLSVRRNPLIAEAFQRTGAIEAWGRGTNRVIEACRAYGIAEPTFAEASGAVTVTFKAEVVAGARNLVPGGHQVGTKSVPRSSARTCGRSARASGTDRPLGANRPGQVPGPGGRAPAGRWPHRDGHPAQAAELETAVTHHRGRARGPRDREEGIRGRKA